MVKMQSKMEIDNQAERNELLKDDKAKQDANIKRSNLAQN